ncbi:MAG: TolB family protein, partial [Acidimicrobiia bacterium]
MPFAQAAPAPGGIERVSVSSSGAERNFLPTGSTTSCTPLESGKCAKRTVSDDGSKVVFTSRAPNLVPGDTNGVADIFVWTRGAAGSPGTVKRITNGNGDSEGPSISPNGQWVSFESKATNLPGGEANGPITDVFVADVQGNIVLASKPSKSGQAHSAGNSFG